MSIYHNPINQCAIPFRYHLSGQIITTSLRFKPGMMVSRGNNREIILKWPDFRLVKYYNLPSFMVLRLTQSLIWKIHKYDDTWQYDMTCGKIITTGCIQDDILSITYIYILGDIVSMWMIFSIIFIQYDYIIHSKIVIFIKWMICV